MITLTSTMSREAGRLASLEIAEYDRAGNLKAKYIESNSSKNAARVDILLPTERKRLWRQILDVFLPDGYPQSVTDDYTPYQIYDSLQAFAGTIAGMISTRAVWEGLGVGDSSATPTGAMLIQVIRECMGKLATIFFAHVMGTSIEAECKAYRLASDVLCDTAIILDCLSPFFPKSVRFLVLCVSSILFSAAGVAGNASKSSLSGHFARWNNLGELNAKDSSQETAISLMGMLAGTFVVSCLSTLTATWTSLIFLLIIHLAMNRLGVRAVKMRTLNRQRANIVFSALHEHNKILTPDEVSKRELIFERRGGEVFRWASGPVIGHCKFGVSLNTLLGCLAQGSNHEKTGSLQLSSIDLAALTQIFQNQQYLLWCLPANSTPFLDSLPQVKVLVVLKDGVTSQSQLKAWFHGLLLARRFHAQQSLKTESRDPQQASRDTQRAMLKHVATTLDLVNRSFEEYSQRLVNAGWDLSVPVLETQAGSRIVMENPSHFRLH